MRPQISWVGAALLLAGLCFPAWAVTADGAMWNATSVGEVGYLPLEDLRSFYKFLPQKAEPGCVGVGNVGVSLVFGPGERELFIQGIRSRLCHPVMRDRQGGLLVSKADMVKLIDPVLRPLYIPNRQEIKTVVIDPGHGGHDAGAHQGQLIESEFTLSIGNQLASVLRQRGYRVVMTHEQNQYMSDQRRVDAANAQSNALYLGLHLNEGRSDYQGIETYTVVPASPGEAERPGNRCDGANIALAYALQAALVHASQARDGGCRRAHFSILSSLTCPAAQVDLGYATHEAEAARLLDSEYQASLVEALANGIDAFAAVMRPDAVMVRRNVVGEQPVSTVAAELPLPSRNGQEKKRITEKKRTLSSQKPQGISSAKVSKPRGKKPSRRTAPSRKPGSSSR